MRVRVRGDRLRAELDMSLWAIEQSALADIVRIVGRHTAGEHLDGDTLTALRERSQARLERSRAAATGSVAVLPVLGTIAHRANVLTDISGGTSTEQLARDFDALVASPDVEAIVLDVESPGGQVAGVPELAEKVFKARGTKPIIAVANSMMASAAYYIASAADEVVATPSALVGSIGVVMLHFDESEAMKSLGVTPTLISAGKHKTSGNPYEPLTDETRELLQEMVDESYDQFVASVAKHRATTKRDVKARYGEGFVLTAAPAKADGLVDRIETIEDTVRRLARPRRSASRLRAQTLELEV